MKIRKKVVKISLLVITIMLSVVSPILAVTAKEQKIVLDPIIIDELIPGNMWADWADAPWLKGSGTFEDPYVIKNVAIDGDGFINCIAIWNSEAHFKIKDCIFSNTKPLPTYERNSGLALFNTTNGVIFKNQFFDNGWMGEIVGSGIALVDSDDNKIQKNLCIDNAATGIYLENSNNNDVIDNYVSGSLWGILLWDIGTGGSNGNLITRNDCIENIETGIAVALSYGNTITNNLCTGNMYGVSIGTWAGYNEVSQNDCKGNSMSGIIIHDNAFENQITDNDFSDNSQNGILLWNNAYDNTITNNTCKENLASGIASIDSNGNFLNENNCSDNGAMGIYLENSQNNNLNRNDCINNSGTGIAVVWSYGNTLTENLCTGNGYGISIGTWAGYNIVTQNDCKENSLSGIIIHENAFDNEITENNCSDNFENGILLINNANNNLIMDNDCNRNAYGIYISNSYENEVIGNTCSENFYEHGILITDGAAFNTISGNTCWKNARSGIVLYNWANFNMITDNICYENFESGIVLDSSYQNTVENNLAHGNGIAGIHVYNAENNIVAGNTCWDNVMVGIRLLSLNNPYMSSTGNKITDNDCIGNLGAGIFVLLSNGNIITDNNCSKNRGNNAIGIGIAAWGDMNSEDNILCGNIIENNERGIFLFNVDNNDVFRNTIKGNDIGIIIEGQSELNLIYHNNFIDNAVQALNEHAGLNNWHNIYMLEGNYWSDYTGIDSDGDGIGDEPWPWWDFDVYPFMEQDGWDILTAQEEELLNAFFDPESNRIAGYRTVRSDETCYIMIGMIQLLSERIERIFCPPFTAHFGFFDVVYSFQGSFWWFWEDFPGYGEPGYTQFFYIILPPYYFPYVGLPPGEYSYQMSFSFYMDGEYNEFAYDSIFYLV